MPQLLLTASFENSQIIDIAKINWWTENISIIKTIEKVDEEWKTHLIQDEEIINNPTSAEDFVKEQLFSLVNKYVAETYWKIKQREIDELVAQHNTVVEWMISQQISITLEK